MGSEHYRLRWNNHQTTLLGVFSQLLEAESLVDVTLASSEGLSLRAHKVVLSACSSYFRGLFLDHPARHPIVILKDVSFAELRTLVEFMYRGEVNVETCRLSALLKTAESLKVKGLAEMTAVRAGGGSPARSPPPPEDEESVQSAPSDMTVRRPSRTPSPPAEPLPGPSGLPPVQDAPLSLKKEMDWDRSDEKSNAGESSSSEYRNPSDPEVCIVEGDFGPSGSRSLDRSLSGSSRSSTPFQYLPAGLASLYGDGLLSILGGIEQFGVRCSLCLAVFPSPWLLDQHVALQHPGQTVSPASPHRTDNDKPFRCQQCGQSYRYRSAYLKHREQNHRARLPADKLFTCDVCGMQFRYLKSFKKHRLNHTLERLHQRPQPVPKEERSSPADPEVTSSNEVTQTARTGVSDQDDTVDSANCDENPSLASLLNNTQRGRTQRAFECPFCGKCVRSKENLKLHVRKHTGERPFACLFCGRAFGGKSDLTRHLRIHTGERPYHCEMCGKCFARADYLSKHLTTHIHHQ